MNEFFHYDNDGNLRCEGLLASKLADTYGTPLYIYSANAFRTQYRALATAFAEVNPLVCYSVKANSTLAILNLLKEEGSGFDVVSRGELIRCLKIGADPKKIVFAGVGKTEDEIRFAIESGILMFNVESENELALIGRVAKALGKKAGIALRLNPDVDPKTHKHITTGTRENKFGIDFARAEASLDIVRQYESLELKGIHLHVGSQITIPTPQAEAITKTSAFVQKVKDQGFPLEFINVGGGFGISYKGTEGLPISAFAEKMLPVIKATGLRMVTEPGRFIAGNSGIMMIRVIYTKKSGDKVFAICDGAMNDLLRPSLYEAYHRIWPANTPYKELPEGEGQLVDIVGPVCESGDYLGKERRLPKLNEGDLISVFSAGAYGFAMASNYNTRPRAAELLVDGTSVRVIRQRETYEDLLSHELAGIQ